MTASSRYGMDCLCLNPCIWVANRTLHCCKLRILLLCSRTISEMDVPDLDDHAEIFSWLAFLHAKRYIDLVYIQGLSGAIPISCCFAQWFFTPVVQSAEQKICNFCFPV
jgi:hypothetical protein